MSTSSCGSKTQKRLSFWHGLTQVVLETGSQISVVVDLTSISIIFYVVSLTNGTATASGEIQLSLFSSKLEVYGTSNSSLVMWSCYRNFQAVDAVVMATDNNFILSILVNISNSDTAQPRWQLMVC